MAENQYQDPILRKYADLVTANTKQFKWIYYGDPIRIPSSNLPCLILAKVDTKFSNETNVEDRHRVRISFTVVTDVRDTISDDKDMVSGTNSLYNLMEGRAETTYQLKPDSLLYILRHNVTLDPGQNLHTDLDSMSSVDYGLTMNKRKPEAWSIEGMVEVTATFIQPR